MLRITHSSSQFLERGLEELGRVAREPISVPKSPGISRPKTPGCFAQFGSFELTFKCVRNGDLRCGDILSNYGFVPVQESAKISNIVMPEPTAAIFESK